MHKKVIDIKLKAALSIFLFTAGLLVLAATPSVSSALDTKAISTGSSDSGGVVVELIPASYKNGKLTINISMNTHSVSLSEMDLAEITVLEYKGKTYRPVKVKAGGGHHAYGKIVFEVEEEPSDFTVTISGIPMIQKRVFKWN